MGEGIGDAAAHRGWLAPRHRNHTLGAVGFVPGCAGKVTRVGHGWTSGHPLTALPGVTGTTWSLGPSWPDLGLSSHTHLAPAGVPLAELGP